MREGLSCFTRWSEANLLGGPAKGDPSLKIEACCKQCGQTFVKYAYERTARCEACRKEGAKLPTLVSLSPCR